MQQSWVTDRRDLRLYLYPCFLTSLHARGGCRSCYSTYYHRASSLLLLPQHAKLGNFSLSRPRPRGCTMCVLLSHYLTPLSGRGRDRRNISASVASPYDGAVSLCLALLTPRRRSINLFLSGGGPTDRPTKKRRESFFLLLFPSAAGTSSFSKISSKTWTLVDGLTSLLTFQNYRASVEISHANFLLVGVSPLIIIYPIASWE